MCDDLAGNTTQTINLACMVDLEGDFHLPLTHPIPQVVELRCRYSRQIGLWNMANWRPSDGFDRLQVAAHRTLPFCHIVELMMGQVAQTTQIIPQVVVVVAHRVSNLINGVTTGTTITSNYSAKTSF